MLPVHSKLARGSSVCCWEPHPTQNPTVSSPTPRPPPGCPVQGQGQGWPPLYNPPGWQYSLGTSLLLVDDLEGAPGQGSARDWDLVRPVLV